MYTRVLALTIFAVVLAYGAVGALAQDREGSMMAHEGMMGHGMMGGGAMGPPPVMRIIFALIDTDSDGTISLQEFQTAHERIFKAMDTDKDGKLTLEEMRAFMHGTR